MMAGRFREIPGKGGIQTGPQGKGQTSQWEGHHTGKGPEAKNRAWLQRGKMGPPEDTVQLQRREPPESGGGAGAWSCWEGDHSLLSAGLSWGGRGCLETRASVSIAASLSDFSRPCTSECSAEERWEVSPAE